MSSESLLPEHEEQTVGLLSNMEARGGTPEDKTLPVSIFVYQCNGSRPHNFGTVLDFSLQRWFFMAIEPNSGVLLASVFNGFGNGVFVFSM
ncbi:hypothetical protein NQ314_001859 [Rhamnusium bicolor]|uniref:Uncharacterized protein n=1 Tax=Rhamnusium bicolor TaxID=1586634 RepID=A0AAV8ZSU6_9CUCU|nr:hypothetical protein NQ314_001859 [Rhamnusium bicolor]